MTLVAQMMPSMQWIPLIALFVGVTILVALIIVGYRLIRKFFPNSKIRLGALVCLAIGSLLVIRFFLPTPISESRVIENAQPGMTIEELVSRIGEPHEKHFASDGSGTLHYYADYIGHTGIGVIVNSDGTIQDTWVE